jgi:hypothetical protein
LFYQEHEFREKAIWLLEEMLHELRIIHRELKPKQHDITSFVITQQGDPMALLPIAPGFSPVFTATPVPSTSVPSTPPTWTSSDTVNAPISVDPTGLIATVAIPTTASVGASFTLTISYTNADGTVATGSFTGTIVAAPSPDITSFTIEQTS